MVARTARLQVAFPDDGAAKRFGSMFKGYGVVICGKHRGEGDSRVVTIQVCAQAAAARTPAIG